MFSCNCPNCTSENVRFDYEYKTVSNGCRKILLCRDCGVSFSETRNTFLEGIRTSASKIWSVINERFARYRFLPGLLVRCAHKNEGASLDRATWQQNIGLYTDMPKKLGNWTHHPLQIQRVSCNELIYIIIKRLWLSTAQEIAFARCGQLLHDQGPLPSLRQWPTQLLFASWPCCVCNVSQNQNHYQADY